MSHYSCIVVGAGHVGCEAAMALARMGHDVLVVTSNADRIGHLSCNPAIGGLAKGHLVFSFRIMRGVYYRVGQSKGKPIEHSHMQSYGKGSLFVTSKNLIFYSAEKSVKIPYSKLVGITPYSDGIEIHKENSKRMAIQGLDPWFIMNYIQNHLL